MSKAKKKPTKKQVEAVLDLADRCAEMVDELGGASFVSGDGRDIETCSYYEGVASAIRWMQGDVAHPPLHEESATELRAYLGESGVLTVEDQKFLKELEEMEA